MIFVVFLASLHHLAAFTLVACLLFEVFTFRQTLSANEARNIQRINLWYGVSSAVLVVAGILRVIYGGNRPRLRSLPTTAPRRSLSNSNMRTENLSVCIIDPIMKFCRGSRSSIAVASIMFVLAACGGSVTPNSASRDMQERSDQSASTEMNESNSTSNPESDPGNGGQHKFLNTTCGGVSDGNFTSQITDVETIHSIFPPGGAAGYEIKPHSYFLIKGERAAVYAPIDMELVQGSFYKEPESFLADNTYILHFAVGCDFAMFIDHITDPVDRIKAVLNTEPREGTRMDYFLDEPLKFKAGELIGYTIGAGPADFVRSWDFGYYSAEVTNQYVNQERRIRSYAWKQLHAVCGFDYFPEPIKSEYLGLFTTRNGKPVPDAGCRSPNRDVAGTLSGSWFFKPDSMSVEPHVGIAGDIDGASLTIVNLGSMSYVSVSSPNPTYKDPATITDRHCYMDDADSSKYFFFVIVDDMTLDVYEGNGPCPSEPTGTKTTLYR